MLAPESLFQTDPLHHLESLLYSHFVAEGFSAEGTQLKPGTIKQQICLKSHALLRLSPRRDTSH
jgi:hypothetical protein